MTGYQDTSPSTDHQATYLIIDACHIYLLVPQKSSIHGEISPLSLLHCGPSVRRNLNSRDSAAQRINNAAFMRYLLAATKQLYKWYFPSVCPSVRLSVCLSVRLSVCPSVRPSVTPFWLCSPHHIIMKFSGVITNDKSKVHAKGQGQRSEVKVTEVTTQPNRFRTVTPVWILIWWWNDAYSLMLLRRGALLFFKVIRQISRSHGSKNRQIWPRLGVSGL